MINDRRCRVLGVTSDGVYLPESQLITFQKDGRLYFYEDDMWKLLYDFTAQNGDTVTYYISEKYIFFDKNAVPILPDQNILASNPYQLVVDHIDTILDISGRPILRYFTTNIIPYQNHNMGIIIENMGSQEKLFGNNTTISLPECTVGEFVGLRCYSDDSTYIKLTSKPCDTLTSIQNIYEKQIKIYPNPSQDIMTISIPDEVYNIDKWQYSLYDMTGQIVKKGKLSGSTTTVDTDGLAVGIYMIRIYNGLGHAGTYKWVKM